jgi:hypothetical protein
MILLWYIHMIFVLHKYIFPFVVLNPPILRTKYRESCQGLGPRVPPHVRTDEYVLVRASACAV